MRKVIRKMEKIYAALQQNRGNIWSQYFPHCLPSRCSPSTFHSLYASLSHDPLHLSPPLALPNFLLDVDKEKYDFLFIQKTARNESENSALSTNNTCHRPHPVLCGVSYMCSYITSSYVRCYSVKGWCWMRPRRHCL